MKPYFQEPYAPRLLFTHTTLFCIIFCLGLFVFPKYDPDDVTVAVSSLSPSYEATKFLDVSRLLISLFITTLVYCLLVSFSYSCRAVYISLYLLSESPRIKTIGVISGSIRRAPYVSHF